MLFRHALVPFIFRFRVRRLTNWISLQSSTSLGIINTPLRTHVIGMFDDSHIAFDYLLGYIIGSKVVFHLIKFRVCTYFMDSLIKQISL